VPPEVFFFFFRPFTLGRKHAICPPFGRKQFKQFFVSPLHLSAEGLAACPVFTYPFQRAPLLFFFILTLVLVPPPSLTKKQLFFILDLRRVS